VGRAWRWHAGTLVQVSIDDTLAGLAGGPGGEADIPAFLRETPAAWFGRWRGATARWQTVRVDARPGDVFVLASGMRDSGFAAADLAGELARATTRTAPELASRLGELAVRHAGDDRRRAWTVHSRLAICVVTIA
jgi:hypothetical protein